MNYNEIASLAVVLKWPYGDLESCLHTTTITNIRECKRVALVGWSLHLDRSTFVRTPPS